MLNRVVFRKVYLRIRSNLICFTHVSGAKLVNCRQVSRLVNAMTIRALPITDIGVWRRFTTPAFNGPKRRLHHAL